MRLRYSLNLHKSEIANILKTMTQKGLLVSEGYGRGMRYMLPQKGTDLINVATSEANSLFSVLLLRMMSQKMSLKTQPTN